MSFCDRLRLDGRAALVTGAATGIGQATAETLAGQGASPLWLVDLDEGGLGEVTDALKAGGTDVRAYVADASSYRAMSETLADGEAIELIANAAGNVSSSRFLELGLPEWQATLDSHTKSCFVTSRLLAPSMVERGRGSIVNVASVAGKRGGGFLGTSAYSAAKAAVNGLTKCVARELAPHGIRVNSVNPGMTNTRRTKLLHADPDVWKRCLAAVPLARIAQPREVAATILWLLSDAASYVTGETINVDGGVSME